MTRERGVRKDWVPSRPMAVYLIALAARETTAVHPNSMEERSSAAIMCERVGLQGERALFRWVYGEVPRMSPMMADRILTRLEILWFDVWNEDTVRLPVITVYSYQWRDKLFPNGTRRRMRVLRRTTPYGDLGPDLATLEHVRRVFDWSYVEPDPEPVPVPVPVVSLADVPLPIDDPVLGDVQAMKLRRMGLSYRQVAVVMASYHGVHRASTTWRGRLRANGERGRAHGTKNLVNQGLAA